MPCALRALWPIGTGEGESSKWGGVFFFHKGGIASPQSWIRHKMAPRNFGGSSVASTFLTDVVTARSRHYGGEPSQMRTQDWTTYMYLSRYNSCCS